MSPWFHTVTASEEGVSMLNDPRQRDTNKLRFNHHTRRIKQRVLKIEQQLDDLVSDVETMEDESHVMFGGTGSSEKGAHSPPPKVGGTCGPSSCPEVRSLDIPRRPDKFFDVYIDLADKPFVLQQQMGLFLKFIAAGEAAGADGLVAYRTEDELREFLKEIKSRTKDPHKYIGNLVHDLKTELEKAGFSRDLVQRNSQGVRFAWRKRATASSERRPPAVVIRA